MNILALRKELEWYKENTKSWESLARESEQDIDTILKAANVNTIPKLLKLLKQIQSE